MSNISDFLANVVMVVHVVVVIFWMAGAFVNKEKFPRLFVFHRAFTILVFLNQLLFLSCPLVTLQVYLLRINHPETEMYESFTAEFIRTALGISIPAMAVSVAIILGGIIGVASLIAFFSQKKVVTS